MHKKYIYINNYEEFFGISSIKNKKITTTKNKITKSEQQFGKK